MFQKLNIVRNTHLLYTFLLANVIWFKKTGFPEKPPIFTDKSFIEKSRFILRVIKDINLTDIK